MAVGEDHGVRLDVRHHAPRKAQRLATRRASAARLVTTFRARRAGHGGSRFDRPRRAAARSSAPRIERSSRAWTPAPRSGRRSRPSRRACWLWSAESATRPASTAGAMTASMKVETIARAVGCVDRPIQSDDAAEGGERIGVARPRVGLGDVVAGRRAAGIGVLDHARRRLVELEHDARGGVEIEEIGERQLFALQDRRRAERGRRIEGVPRGRLMRVLAVAEIAELRARRWSSWVGARRPRCRRRGEATPSSTRTSPSVEAIARVVGAGVRKRAARKLEAERQRRALPRDRARRAPRRSPPGSRRRARRESSWPRRAPGWDRRCRSARSDRRTRCPASRRSRRTDTG